MLVDSSVWIGYFKSGRIEKLDSLIDESDDLPLNHDMFANEEWLVISTFYAGGSEKIVVLYNKTSKETAYCRVPPHFFPVSFNENELIGKNSKSDGDIRLQMLKVKLPG